MTKCKYPNCDYPCMNLPDCQEQKPVKWSDYEPDGVHHTTSPSMKCEGPQQRTWVSLTDDDRMELYKLFVDSDEWTYEKAIEARLKELNT
jgi:hypothetical protein